ncbi:MAG TPA: zf-HC2 domain-containing protein [Kofleriaceae bacterium]|nr:zf-HC2 domain-containing protein [Kofleriaceae bacterium]
MSCATPLTDEQLVAYWADDLDEAALAQVEEHLFACDECLANATHVQQVAQAFRGLPPVISHAELAALRARGLTIVDNDFIAERRTPVTFERHVDFMIHHLTGLDLTAAERVEVIVRDESGKVMFEEPIAPFDPQSGEILIACQRHFAAFPPDVVFDVRVHRAAAPPALSTFCIPHVFAS